MFKNNLRKTYFILPLSLILLSPSTIFSSSINDVLHSNGTAFTFFMIAIVLIMAKISSLMERIGQPSVLGELLIGILLGNFFFLFNIDFFESVKTNQIILFLGELGVVILLFQIGLESNLKEMSKVGLPAILVALIGVILPFTLGTWFIGPWLMPDLSFYSHLFLGAALTATSVSISARVFKDLNVLHSKEAQIVLGAAVIDDILGLTILAIVSALVTVGTITAQTIFIIMAKAIVFLLASITIGQYIAPLIGKFFSKIQSGTGMKFTLALSFCLIFSYLAEVMGLAPIVGAFSAGLILDQVTFKTFKRPQINDELERVCKDSHGRTKRKLHEVIDHENHRHIEHLIEPIAFLVVPIFFILTGMSVDLPSLLDPTIFVTALLVTTIGIVGKILSGLGGGRDVNKLIIGLGMVPRGEVGLIFAMIGTNLGVLPDSLFSVIVIMVIATTVITPSVLSSLIRSHSHI